MIRTYVVFAAALLCSASTARAQTYLGSATDPYSCYSHCGETRTNSSGTPTCYCDSFCQSRGDCCGDRDEFCSVTTGAGYCALTNSNSDQQHAEFGRFCGTDLGFNYTYNGAIEVLFGDTWQFYGSTCQDPAIQEFANDDSQGTLPLTRPTWLPGSAAASTPIGNCQAGTFAMDMTGVGATRTYAPITLTDWLGFNVQLVGLDTPTAGFSDGSHAWAVFGAKLAPFRTNYVAYRVGPDTAYHAIPQTLPNTHFQSPSAAVVKSLTDFNPPTAAGGVVLMFGRPRFSTNPNDPAPNNDPATNLVYLMYQNLPLSTNGSNWAPRYFVSRKPAGGANWSSNLSAATPIIDSDFAITQQIDVKYVPQIKKWVMLYGGSMADWWGVESTNPQIAQPRHGAIHMRTADYPWGPWTRPAPALFREKMGQLYHCDATPTSNPAGCDDPWSIGTWTQGGNASIPGCRIDAPEPKTPSGCSSAHQRGNLYSAQMILPWTTGGGYDPVTRTASTSLATLVSSWFPYQVNLALIDLVTTPAQTFNSGIMAQLRDKTNLMVSRGSTTTPANTAGSPTPYAPVNTTWVVNWVASPAACSDWVNRGPVIGDTVYFYNTKNGNRWLGRNAAGTAVEYITETATLSPRAKWVLESTDAANYPTCTPIRFGTTPFRMKDPASSQRLRSSGGLSVTTTAPGTSNTFQWKLNIGCLGGTSPDVCTPKTP